MNTLNPDRTIGILGAGRVGTILAKLAVNAGYRVHFAGSGDPSRIEHIATILGPRATAATVEDAANAADIVILALPLAQHTTLPVDALRGKIIIDATNYWWETDGVRAEYTDPLTSTSEIVQAFFPDSRVVKALNHMEFRDLDDESRPANAPGRKALAIAGDDPAAVEAVAALVDAFGFDPVNAGPLSEGVRMEPNTELFGANVDAAEVKAMLERFPRSARGMIVARARANRGD